MHLQKKPRETRERERGRDWRTRNRNGNVLLYIFAKIQSSCKYQNISLEHQNFCLSVSQSFTLSPLSHTLTLSTYLSSISLVPLSLFLPLPPLHSALPTICLIFFIRDIVGWQCLPRVHSCNLYIVMSLNWSKTTPKYLWWHQTFVYVFFSRTWKHSFFQVFKGFFFQSNWNMRKQKRCQRKYHSWSYKYYSMFKTIFIAYIFFNTINRAIIFLSRP